MSTEHENELVAPAATETETAESVEKAPEPTPEEAEAKAKADEQGEDAESKAIKAMQKRIDKLTRQKYEAKARADLLEQQIRGREQQSTQAGLSRDQYSSDEEYIDAVVEARLAQKEQAKAQEAKSSRIQRIFKEAESLGDFDVEDFRAVPVSAVMADAILESEVAPHLVKYFHDEPEEAERIANLTPARQAAEIGKLEARFSGEKTERDEAPKAAKKSAAPPPIKPVGGSGSSGGGYRPDMSFEAYRKWRAAQK